MSQSTRERALTPPEVQDRTAVLLHLLDEQDTIRFRVRASRDELREWRVEARKLATQIDEVRQEIRTGIVTEPAQQDLPHMEKPPARVWPEETEDECSARTVREEMATEIAEGRGPLEVLGIDGSSDKADPETDPPPPDPYWGFNANYPKAERHLDLWDALREALTPDEFAKLEAGNDVGSWHRSSGQFEAVAHWVRVENAHRSHADRKPTPGITVPARFPMPLALAQALAKSQPKKPAKAAKKKRTRKAAA